MRTIKVISVPWIVYPIKDSMLTFVGFDCNDIRKEIIFEKIKAYLAFKIEILNEIFIIIMNNKYMFKFLDNSDLSGMFRISHKANNFYINQTFTLFIKDRIDNKNGIEIIWK